MGCVVNGPGEAKEADIGLASGKHCGLIFKQGEIIGKFSEDELLFEHLGSNPVKAVVNNGTEDLDSTKGYSWLKGNDCVKDAQGKHVFHETSRAPGLTTYFTSEGDDASDVTKVGGGELIEVEFDVGDDSEKSTYIDFNVKENQTMIHEGYMTWFGGLGDRGSLSIVSTVTNVSAGTNTFYNLYGGYLVIPAAGDGTVQIAPEDIRLVEMPPSQDTGIRAQAFWNADYNSTLHQFENITAAPAGNGHYNMFAAEITLSRFANNILFVNNGFIMLQSSDSQELGHGMRLKLTGTMRGDHEWRLSCILTMHRARTA